MIGFKESQQYFFGTRTVAFLICALANETRSNPAKIAEMLKGYLFEDADLKYLTPEFDFYNSRNAIDFHEEQIALENGT